MTTCSISILSGCWRWWVFSFFLTLNNNCSAMVPLWLGYFYYQFTQVVFSLFTTVSFAFILTCECYSLQTFFPHSVTQNWVIQRDIGFGVLTNALEHCHNVYLFVFFISYRKGTNKHQWQSVQSIRFHSLSLYVPCTFRKLTVMTLHIDLLTVAQINFSFLFFFCLK